MIVFRLAFLDSARRQRDRDREGQTPLYLLWLHDLLFCLVGIIVQSNGVPRKRIGFLLLCRGMEATCPFCFVLHFIKANMNNASPNRLLGRVLLLK